MLKQRVITAVVLIPVLVAGILLLPTIWFAALTAIFILQGAREWAGLSGFSTAASGWWFMLIAAIVLGAVFFQADRQQWELLLLMAGLWWIIALVWVIAYSLGRAPGTGLRGVRAIAGLPVLVPAWVAVVMLHGSSGAGGWLVLGVMVLVWAADIAAYFAGRRFGRHKLAPRLSPGKTWEGVFGGVLGAAIVVLIMGRVAGLSDAVLPMLVSAGALVALVSVIGDLFESMLKRMAQIKDSSNILPGHGGVLDRIDSLTAAAPLAVMLLPILGIEIAGVGQ